MTYTPMKDGEGVSDVGYISPTLPVFIRKSGRCLAVKEKKIPMLGTMTKLVTPTAAILINSDNGVKTCSLSSHVYQNGHPELCYLPLVLTA